MGNFKKALGVRTMDGENLLSVRIGGSVSIVDLDGREQAKGQLLDIVRFEPMHWGNVNNGPVTFAIVGTPTLDGISGTWDRTPNPEADQEAHVSCHVVHPDNLRTGE